MYKYFIDFITNDFDLTNDFSDSTISDFEAEADDFTGTLLKSLNLIY